jgi:translation initiation factor IF-3
MFRGREMAHTDLGRKILDRLVEDLKDVAVVDAFPKQEGRNMIMVIAPVKRAPEKKPEAAPAVAPVPTPAPQPATPAPEPEPASAPAAAEPIEG